MAWLRSPLLYGALFLTVGLVLRIILSFPEAGEQRAGSVDDLRRTVTYQRDVKPIQGLEPRYRPYAFAFILAGSDAEVATIKKAIDDELVASATIRERGLAGVPEYLSERLSAVDMVLMALGAALIFRSLAFVLAAGFGAGLLHEQLRQADTITGSPSEFFLAAVLAALIWSAALWALRALFEGRLRFS